MSLTSHGHIKIGTTEFCPKSLKQTYESLADEDSGRTADGTMHINWILKRIRKLEIEMPPCSPSQASAILNLVQGRTYTVTYWDLITNAEKSISCYTSNSNADWYSGVINTNGLVQGLSFNAIEMSGET